MTVDSGLRAVLGFPFSVINFFKGRKKLSSYQNIKYELNGHIAIITIDHPPANTWNLATLTEFEDAIGVVETDSNVRVLILTGAGEKCFSAGFDVSDAANAPIISPKARALWRRIDRLSKPVIAAINGHALGGGQELAISFMPFPYHGGCAHGNGRPYGTESRHHSGLGGHAATFPDRGPIQGTGNDLHEQKNLCWAST